MAALGIAALGIASLWDRGAAVDHTVATSQLSPPAEKTLPPEGPRPIVAVDVTPDNAPETASGPSLPTPVPDKSKAASEAPCSTFASLRWDGANPEKLILELARLESLYGQELTTEQANEIRTFLRSGGDFRMRLAVILLLSRRGEDQSTEILLEAISNRSETESSVFAALGLGLGGSLRLLPSAAVWRRFVDEVRESHLHESPPGKDAGWLIQLIDLRLDEGSPSLSTPGDGRRQFLLDLLRGDEREVLREAAALALSGGGSDPEVVQSLMTSAADPSREVRRYAVVALGRAPVQETQSFLLARLGVEHDTLVRSEIFRALRPACVDPSVETVLRQAFEETQEPSDQVPLMDTLTSPQAPSRVPFALHVLESRPEPFLRSDAIEALNGERSEEVFIAVRRALRDKSLSVRLAAVEWVAGNEDIDSLQALRDLAQRDPEEAVRSFAGEKIPEMERCAAKKQRPH